MNTKLLAGILLVVLVGCGSDDSGSAPAPAAAPSKTVDLKNPASYSARISGVLGDEGRFQMHVVAAGDVNGDGRADLLMGAPGADFNNRTNCGAVHVVFGSGATPAGSVDLGPVANSAIVYHGSATFGLLGAAMATGDLNGDGRGDLAIAERGAARNGRAGSGSVYVIFGGPAIRTGVIDLDGGSSFAARFDGAAAGDSLGSSVAIGDVNSDGIADLVMGADGADPLGRTDAGALYVRYGGSSFPTGAIDLATAANADIEILGAAAGDCTAPCAVMAGALVIGAPGADPQGRDGAGVVTVVDPMTGVIDLASGGRAVFHGVAAGDALGRTIAVSGTSLLLAAPAEDALGRSDAGAAHLFFDGPSLGGTRDLASSPGDLVCSGAAAGDGLGASMTIARHDPDPLVDVILGAPGADNGGRADSGSVYVVLGGASGPRDMADAYYTRYDGSAAGDALGASVGAADVIGDGWTELLMGAPRADLGLRLDCGRVYAIAVWGSASTGVDMADDANYSQCWEGSARGSFFATYYALADLNADGVKDIVISSPYENRNGRLDSGSVYVIFGGPSLAKPQDLSLDDATSYGVRVDGAAAGDSLGDRMIGLGDVNGDGTDDLIVGARAADNNGRSNSGSVYVIFGRASWAQQTFDLGAGQYDARIDGAAAGDQFGFMHSVGDVTGDGVGDLVVCAAFADANGRSNSGSLYMVRGRKVWPASLDMATGFDARWDGAGAGDLAGYAPSVADFDGDGRADLAFGAPGASPNGNMWMGSVYVVYGGSAPAGVYDLAVGGYDARIDGEAAGDQIGLFVNAVDADADGRADLLLTAWSSDATLVDAGCGYVIYGRAQRLSGAGLNALAVSDAQVLGPLSPSYFLAASFTRMSGGRHGVLVTAMASGAVYQVDEGTARLAGTYDLSAGGFTMQIVDTHVENQMSTAFQYRGSSDVTGDGIDDLVLNERMGEARYWDAGNVYVIPGR